MSDGKDGPILPVDELAQSNELLRTTALQAVVTSREAVSLISKAVSVAVDLQIALEGLARGLGIDADKDSPE